MMKALAWIVGLAGILVGAIGVLGGLRGHYIISIFGRPHAPSTFMTAGILLLAIGIWAGVVGCLDKVDEKS